MTKILFTLALALVLGLSATSAWATSLTVGDAYYVGFYVPPEPASPSDEVGYINNLITVAAGGTLVDGAYT